MFSETWIFFDYVFYVFLKCHFKKTQKVAFFWIFKKNVKNVFSNYAGRPYTKHKYRRYNISNSNKIQKQTGKYLKKSDSTYTYLTMLRVIMFCMCLFREVRIKKHATGKCKLLIINRSKNILPVQLNPSPWYPTSQVQVTLSFTLAQVANSLQPPLFSAHLSTSVYHAKRSHDINWTGKYIW